MNILLLCGYYEEACQTEVLEKIRANHQNAANSFQEILIEALRGEDNALEIISAPFVGAWPQSYSDIFFRGFREETRRNIRYVQFCNIWGWRNISRTNALKRAVKEYIMRSEGESRMIVVYSPHTPFLEAAVYAKSLDPRCRICLVVPDLPQYMNLSKDPHPVYDLFKSVDIRRFMKLNAQVDSYMLLTKHMTEPMQVKNRPYIVVEGIVGQQISQSPVEHAGSKKITYAGTLNEAFGIRNLLDAFMMFDEADVSLELYGNGDMKDEITRLSKLDKRIHYHGVVSADLAAQELRASDVLVNPRLNNEEYTKYSFPSKTLEYLNSGNAVVAYMLDGMPENYRDFLYVPADDSAETLYCALKQALNACSSEIRNKYKQAQEYMHTSLSPEQLSKRLAQLWQQ